MSIIWTIMQKELRSYLSQPLAYIIFALFVFINGWIFFNLLVQFVDSIQNLPPGISQKIRFEEAVILKMFGNIHFILLFITPLLTMRILAEEKKQGSIDVLMSAPIKDWQIVLGKYFAVLVIGSLTVLSTLIFPMVLSFSGLGHWDLFLSGYSGIFFTLSCYLAMGLFASGLSKNSVVAAIVGFLFIFSSWLVTWLAQSTSNYMLMEIFRYLGMVVHFEQVVKGIINTSDLSYFLCCICLFLLMSKKTLEARHW